MVAVQCKNHHAMTYEARRVRIARTLRERKLTMAAACRATGDYKPGRYGFVRRVIVGDETSAPLLTQLETWLNLEPATA